MSDSNKDKRKRKHKKPQAVEEEVPFNEDLKEALDFQVEFKDADEQELVSVDFEEISIILENLFELCTAEMPKNYVAPIIDFTMFIGRWSCVHTAHVVAIICRLCGLGHRDLFLKDARLPQLKVVALWKRSKSLACQLRSLLNYFYLNQVMSFSALKENERDVFFSKYFNHLDFSRSCSELRGYLKFLIDASLTSSVARAKTTALFQRSYTLGGQDFAVLCEEMRAIFMGHRSLDKFPLAETMTQEVVDYVGSVLRMLDIHRFVLQCTEEIRQDQNKTDLFSNLIAILATLHSQGRPCGFSLEEARLLSPTDRAHAVDMALKVCARLMGQHTLFVQGLVEQIIAVVGKCDIAMSDEDQINMWKRIDLLHHIVVQVCTAWVSAQQIPTSRPLTPALPASATAATFSLYSLSTTANALPRTNPLPSQATLSSLSRSHSYIGAAENSTEMLLMEFETLLQQLAKRLGTPNILPHMSRRVLPALVFKTNEYLESLLIDKQCIAGLEDFIEEVLQRLWAAAMRGDRSRDSFIRRGVQGSGKFDVYCQYVRVATSGDKALMLPAALTITVFAGDLPEVNLLEWNVLSLIECSEFHDILMRLVDKHELSHLFTVSQYTEALEACRQLDMDIIERERAKRTVQRQETQPKAPTVPETPSAGDIGSGGIPPTPSVSTLSVENTPAPSRRRAARPASRATGTVGRSAGRRATATGTPSTTGATPRTGTGRRTAGSSRTSRRLGTGSGAVVPALVEQFENAAVDQNAVGSPLPSEQHQQQQQQSSSSQRPSALTIPPQSSLLETPAPSSALAVMATPQLPRRASYVFTAGPNPHTYTHTEPFARQQLLNTVWTAVRREGARVLPPAKLIGRFVSAPEEFFRWVGLLTGLAQADVKLLPVALHRIVGVLQELPECELPDGKHHALLSAFHDMFLNLDVFGLFPRLFEQKMINPVVKELTAALSLLGIEKVLPQALAADAPAINVMRLHNALWEVHCTNLSQKHNYGNSDRQVSGASKSNCIVFCPNTEEALQMMLGVPVTSNRVSDVVASFYPDSEGPTSSTMELLSHEASVLQLEKDPRKAKGVKDSEIPNPHASHKKKEKEHGENGDSSDTETDMDVTDSDDNTENSSPASQNHAPRPPPRTLQSVNNAPHLKPVKVTWTLSQVGVMYTRVSVGPQVMTFLKANPDHGARRVDDYGQPSKENLFGCYTYSNLMQSDAGRPVQCALLPATSPQNAVELLYNQNIHFLAKIRPVSIIVPLAHGPFDPVLKTLDEHVALAGLKPGVVRFLPVPDSPLNDTTTAHTLALSTFTLACDQAQTFRPSHAPLHPPVYLPSPRRSVYSMNLLMALLFGLYSFIVSIYDVNNDYFLYGAAFFIIGGLIIQEVFVLLWMEWVVSVRTLIYCVLRLAVAALPVTALGVYLWPELDENNFWLDDVDDSITALLLLFVMMILALIIYTPYFEFIWSNAVRSFGVYQPKKIKKPAHAHTELQTIAVSPSSLV
eukprot:GCRY01002173.1.p1 GENE.GCRY01002173.1~~GCRY01002173.1.p1  ORF type:complete len:1488 (-),score=427.90 GCRY01002173.1:170-4633(-)